MSWVYHWTMPQFETSKVYLTRIFEKLQYVVNHILDCKEGEFYDFNEEGNFCDKNSWKLIKWSQSHEFQMTLTCIVRSQPFVVVSEKFL